MANTAEQQQAAQRAYYARTADDYDSLHWGKIDEHQFALSFVSGIIDLLGVTSVLDLGSGTGRALLTLKARHPGLRIVGIEPSPELRAIGHAKGPSETELTAGDARALEFPDGSFDLVTEFATLHHIPKPELAVKEMLRISRLGIFVSDSNNYGQGSPTSRALKSLLRQLGLWRAFDFVRTRGKGYMVSEGDGLYYSYSVFNNYWMIKRACKSVHILNTLDAGIDPLRTASHVALLGLKRDFIKSS
jgi:ubiquinone/menaquinone biosynthesis C-methylase UbiE